MVLRGRPVLRKPRFGRDAMEPYQAVAPAGRGRNATLIPTVALLFLTKGDMPLHRIWEEWLDVSRGWVPKFGPSDTGRDDVHIHGGIMLQPTKECVDELSTNSQLLYTVYIHAPPSFKGYPNMYDALWNKALLDTRHRVHALWGTMRLVDATKSLLRAAYQDERNTWFVLLSESDIPLFDPLTTYVHLMSSNKSFINACPEGPIETYRYDERMELFGIKEKHWRKSSQFMTLLRKHVEIALNDNIVYKAFSKYCNVEKTFCVGDEHYFPTLLAVKQLENETYCDSWGSSATSWPDPKASHPKTVSDSDNVMEEVRSFRWSGVSAEKMTQYQHAAIDYFCKLDDKTVKESGLKSSSFPFPIPQLYHVFARKFDPSTAPKLLSIFEECSSDSLFLLTVPYCTL